MSGYRSLHRQKLVSSFNDNHQQQEEEAVAAAASAEKRVAVWCVQLTPLLYSSDKQKQQQQQEEASSSSSSSFSSSYRLWTATSDGLVRSFRVQESSATNVTAAATSLDASALRLTCTHVLYGPSQQQQQQQQPPNRTQEVSSSSSLSSSSNNATTLGCTRLSIVRYRDSWIILSLDLSGAIRLWRFVNGFDDNDDHDENPSHRAPRTIQSLVEFTVPHATGTTAALCPPPDAAGTATTDHETIMVAVGCLDGSIALVSTGLSYLGSSTTSGGESTTTTSTSNPHRPGDIVERLGASSTGGAGRRPGSTVPLCLCWSPVEHATGKGRLLVVGRQDGVMDVLLVQCRNCHRYSQPNSSSSSCLVNLQRLSRHHHSPVRALAFTQDGNLLLVGSDEGLLTVWDTSRAAPVAAESNAAPASTHTTLAVLVHHVLQAHASWILQATSCMDGHRFITAGADKTLSVWDVRLGLHQPAHTFQTDAMVWTLHAVTSSTTAKTTNHNNNRMPPRMVTGSDTGWVQFFSIER